MKKSIHLAPSLSLPLDLATQAVAVLGIRGSGKTNTAGVIAEECLKAGIPVAIIDPVDAWWGLRSSASGQEDGWPVLIFGGTHGDLPLAENDGRTIAEFIAKEQVPCILSLRHLRKAAQRRFVADVFEDLYHLKGKPEHRTPLCVVIDEAPLFVPQQVQGDVARTVGAVEDLVNRGRISGFGVVLVSQRAATINKNVLTQADTIVTHRLTSPQDRKALRDWIEENATIDELADVLSSLATLKTGEAWVWAPALDVMQRTVIRKRETFDSSKTPKIGERVQSPRRLAEIDLDVYRGRLGKVMEEARENDPKELKKKLAELQRQLQQQKQPESVEVQVPVLENGQLEAASRMVVQLQDTARECTSAAALLSQAITAAGRPTGTSPRLQPKTVPARNPLPLREGGPVGRPAPLSSDARPPVQRPAAESSEGGITKPARRILNALAWWEAAGVRLPSRHQVAFVARYTVNGHFNNTVGELRTNGLLDFPGSGLLTLTDAGRAHTDPVTSAPSRDALIDTVRQVLREEPQRRVFDVLVREGRPLSREELAAGAGYTVNGHFNNVVGSLHGIGVAEYPGRGMVSLSGLFEALA